MSIGTLKVLFWVAFGLTLALTVYVAWLNSASEKVQVNVPAAAWLGTVGVLVTLLFSVAKESVQAEFPVSFVYDTETMLPFDCASFREIRVYSTAGDPYAIEGMVGAALKADPSLATAPRGLEVSREATERVEKLEELYFDVLARRVFDILSFTFGHTWRSKVTRFQLPDRGLSTSAEAVPGAPIAKGTVFERDAFLPLFRQPAVLRGFGSQYTPKVVAPPDTTLRAFRERHGAVLSLVNQFVSVTVTMQTWGGRGGLGQIQDLCPQLVESEPHEFDRRYKSSHWVLQLKAEFDALHSGNAAMPDHRAWVELLFGELRLGLDSERRWKEMKEAYEFQAVLRSRDLMSQAGRAPTGQP